MTGVETFKLYRPAHEILVLIEKEHLHMCIKYHYLMSWPILTLTCIVTDIISPAIDVSHMNII